METIVQTNGIETINTQNYSNPIYLIRGEGSFYETESRIMSNLPMLIPCNKAELNGVTELVYLTEKYVSLNLIIEQIKEENLLSLLASLCEGLEEIRNNGFLNWQNIDFSIEHIFVDRSDAYSVHLIYLPVEGVYVPPNYLDKEICKYVRALTNMPLQNISPKLTAIRQHIDEYETLSCKDLAEYIRFVAAFTPENKQDLKDDIKNTVLELFDSRSNYRLIVDKPSFILGKKESAVDGVVYSQYVGRTHCQIVCKEGKYYVYDLDSRNGTFVDGIKVNSDEGAEIKDGNKLKLANIVFDVIVREG